MKRYVRASTIRVDEMENILRDYILTGDEDVIDVVSGILGRNEETMLAILDQVTGYKNFDQAAEEYGYGTDDVYSSTSVMAASWKAPNGKKYGKQTRRFPGKFLFTRKELRDMVDSGIAEDMAGTFDPGAMNYDIIGISWNDTNGHRTGILIEDRDTGDLYVGNTYDASVAKL